MGQGVIADPVPLVACPLEDFDALRRRRRHGRAIFIALCADEERRLDTPLGERIEHLRRAFRIGAVVERQRELAHHSFTAAAGLSTTTGGVVSLNISETFSSLEPSSSSYCSGGRCMRGAVVSMGGCGTGSAGG